MGSVCCGRVVTPLVLSGVAPVDLPSFSAPTATFGLVDAPPLFNGLSSNMATKTISCPVDTQGDYGVYANAFRVMQDGSDAVLDFCLYSESDNQARTVCRVRVPPSFLKVVLARLQSAVEIPEQAETGTLYLMPSVPGSN